MSRQLFMIAMIGTAALLVLVWQQPEPKRADTICADGFPAQTQSVAGRYDRDGNAVWVPDDPALYYACP